MPNYEYECKTCGRFEVFQKMSDERLTKCPTCGKSVERIISQFGLSFAGSGFYVNDSKSGVSHASETKTESDKTGANTDTPKPKCSGKSCAGCSGCK